MDTLKKTVISGLSLLVAFSMLTIAHAGEHAEKDNKDKRKALSGVVTVESVDGADNYILTVRSNSEQSKTYPLSFTDEYNGDLPEDGDRVTVRGQFETMEDDSKVFHVKWMNNVTEKSRQEQTE